MASHTRKQYLICFPDKLNIGYKVWFYNAGEKKLNSILFSFKQEKRN